jgi:hypothetical protein
MHVYQRILAVVIEHHLCAARRADELFERGDVQGYEVWLAILAVLEAAKVHL